MIAFPHGSAAPGSRDEPSIRCPLSWHGSSVLGTRPAMRTAKTVLAAVLSFVIADMLNTRPGPRARPAHGALVVN